jgi:hypothetical protein
MRWSVTLACAGLGAAALARYHLTGLGLGLASVALLVAVAVQRMRLVADESGVTVVNLFAGHHIAWADVSDFRRSRIALGACLDVCKNDGTRVHSWVVSAIGRGPYSQANVFEALSDFNRRLVDESGRAEIGLGSRAAVDLARRAATG